MENGMGPCMYCGKETELTVHHHVYGIDSICDDCLKKEED